ncbi:hypothetical protein NQD34_017769 [Periophthalmus magnuspinnatus]|nr:hypothetical protein NQD34_017769 [Periophthalmus magnuspinnatus]
MVLSKLVSSWSVEDVLEWVQEQHPTQMATLHKAIIKHSISGCRLKEHHLEQLGVETEEEQQAILQDLLLLKIHEEITELSQICSGKVAYKKNA